MTRLVKITKPDLLNQGTTFDELQTLEQMYCSFIHTKQSENKSPSTIKYYNENFNLFTQFLSKDTLCCDIVLDDVQDFVLYLEQYKNRNSNSINTALRAIRVIMYWGMKKGLISTFKINLLTVDETLKEIYTEEELRKLLRKPTNDNWGEWRNWAIINFLLSTGVRASTLVNIKIKDINFNTNSIYLRHLKTRTSMEIPLSQKLSSTLHLYLSLYSHVDEDYLFPSQYGTLLAVRSLQVAIIRYNRSRNVSKTSIHLFRHTYALLYIKNGGNQFKLQRLLGHRTLEMTQKYVNLSIKELQQDYTTVNPLDQLYV